ncbi:MAG TPA: phosphoribosylanthranilate isomerase, partial [Candidatus Polarisedimenticolia bacterium]|nr:phosphoribosylanthranilate isomerase [Candidatus Polarisedimenticolia bacterium]
MRVRVKICGITRREDAESAVESGADAVGFVLWEGSPRGLRPEAAAALGRDLPAWVARIGVFVRSGNEAVEHAARLARLSAAQLHGYDSFEACRGLGIDWYPVFPLGDAPDLAARAQEIGALGMRTFMVDSVTGSMPGGTGRTVDWRLAAKLSMRLSLAGSPRLILAGGLTPDNVAEAIRLVRPWGVD